MKFHLRFDRYDSHHTHMTLFVNGQNAGTLCMDARSVHALHQMMHYASFKFPGVPSIIDEFVSSGEAPPHPDLENDA